MAYVKTVWTNGATALSAEHMNNIEEGIESLDTKLSGIESGAEVNQNAFSNVKVGSSTIEADSKTDTLEIEAGSGITLAADTSGDKVTISSKVISIKSINVTDSLTFGAGSSQTVVFPLGISDIDDFVSIRGFNAVSQSGGATVEAVLAIAAITPANYNDEPVLSVNFFNPKSSSVTITKITIRIAYVS